MRKSLLAVVGVLCLAGSLAYADEDAKTKAADYAAKAQAQDAVITEHTAMKQTVPNRKDDAMQVHCNKLISDARKLKSDYEWFQKYYEAKAAEGK